MSDSDSIFDDPLLEGEAAPAPAGEASPRVQEFLALDRRRIRGDAPLAPAEAQRWSELREVFDYAFGSAPPPLAGSRRRSLRVPSQAKVRVTGGAESVTSLRNLSEDGAFVELPDPPPPETPLTLEIDPGGAGAPLRLDAVVIWRRELPGMDGPAGAGVAFPSLEDGDFERLRGLVESSLIAADAPTG